MIVEDVEKLPIATEAHKVRYKIKQWILGNSGNSSQVNIICVYVAYFFE